MPNVSVSQFYPLTFEGTINAGGTLTNEIDLDGFTLHGLIATTSMVAGTITFEVSHLPESNSGAVYSELVGSDGSAVSIGPVSGTFAVSGVVITQALAPYRYVKIKTSSTQTSGLQIVLPAKA